MSIYRNTQQEIMDEIQKALNLVDENQVEELVEKLENAEKIFFVGVGRVLFSLEAVAKRLAHIGFDTVIVGQTTEPAITEKDLLIVGSGSGESLFPLGIAKKAKQFEATVAHIGSNPNSSMQVYSDIFVRIPVSTKLDLPDEVQSIQPMTSLFEQSLLLLGDTVALLLVKKNNLNMKELWRFHANLE